MVWSGYICIKIKRMTHKTMQQHFDSLTESEKALYLERLRQRHYGEWLITAWKDVPIPASLFMALVDYEPGEFRDFIRQVYPNYAL